MNISKMFIKSKLFFLKNKYLIIISTFITATISFIVCIAFYSLSEEPYSFKNILFGTLIAFILLIWIVWCIIKYFLSPSLIYSLKKYWGAFLIICLAVFVFLNSGLYSLNLDFIKPPNLKYEVQITPSEDSSGSICIRDLKNNWGRINEINDSIFDIHHNIADDRFATRWLQPFSLT